MRYFLGNIELHECTRIISNKKLIFFLGNIELRECTLIITNKKSIFFLGNIELRECTRIIANKKLIFICLHSFLFVLIRVNSMILLHFFKGEKTFENF